MTGFERGRRLVDDDQRSGRSSTKPENVPVDRNVIMKDRPIHLQNCGTWHRIFFHELTTEAGLMLSFIIQHHEDENRLNGL